MSKEYCKWALEATQNYYNRLLQLEQDNPWTNLRLPHGQIPWTKAEIEEWTYLTEEYS